jgi:hypothetical protein
MERTVEAGKIDGKGKIDGRVRAFSQKKKKEPGKNEGAVRTVEAVRSEGVKEN